MRINQEMKLKLNTPVVAIGIGFLIVWYVLSQQQQPTYYEHLTGAPILGDEDKKAVNDYLSAKIRGGKPEDVKLTTKAKEFLKFLEDHPISSIDDAFVNKYMELEKQASGGGGMATPEDDTKGKTKQRLRDEASYYVLSRAIWGYADYYEKAEKTPSRSEFDKDMLKVVKNEPLLNMGMNQSRMATTQIAWVEKELEDAKKREPTQWERMLAAWRKTSPEEEKNKRIESLSRELARLQMTTLAVGENEFPFPSGSSPIISQLLDTVYIYYYPQTAPDAGAFGKSIVAFIAGFGSIILGVIVLYLLYSYVISPLLNRSSTPAV